MCKFKLTDEKIKYKGKILYRIKALKNFVHASKGDLGGYVEGYKNLSQRNEAWVKDEAKVYDNGEVCNQAIIEDNAEVFDSAKVLDKARVYNNAKVYGKSRVKGSAKVHGDSEVGGTAKIYGLVIDLPIAPRVDTTNTDIMEVYELWRSHLSNHPEKIYDNPYWSEQQKDMWEDYDISRRWTYGYEVSNGMHIHEMFKMKPRVLSIEKRDSRVCNLNSV